MLKLKHFIEFLNETNSVREYEYGCLMVYLKNNEEFKDIQSEIKPDILGKVGLEEECHLTLLYGIEKDADENEILNFMTNFKPIKIQSEALNLFENEEDVLKMDVLLTDELSEIREFLIKNISNTQKYLEYKPHITVAYLKKGQGAVFIEPNLNIEFKIDKLVYSRIDHTVIESKRFD